jgi:hypothetical protein
MGADRKDGRTKAKAAWRHCNCAVAEWRAAALTHLLRQGQEIATLHLHLPLNVHLLLNIHLLFYYAH